MMSNVNEPQSVKEIICEQSTVDVFKKAAASVGTPGSQYSVYLSVFHVLQSSIDGALQKVVSKSLQARIPIPNTILYSAFISDNYMSTTGYVEIITVPTCPSRFTN